MREIFYLAHVFFAEFRHCFCIRYQVLYVFEEKGGFIEKCDYLCTLKQQKL